MSDHRRTTDELVDFVREAHKGQVDKCGADYFEAHLLPVARSVPRELFYAALAHDILEDTSTTVDALNVAGFTAHEIELIELVTKPPKHERAGTWENEYFDHIANNSDAKTIKVMDIASNLSRIHNLHDQDEANRLITKYLNALTQLMR